MELLCFTQGRGMALQSRIERIVDLIQKGQIASEAEVISGIISPVLRELGWDIDDPTVVKPEFRVESLAVDRALFTEPHRPKVFVEAKAFGFLANSGAAADAEQQLFRYCGFHSVPIAVLTDGQEWRIYLPKEEGKIVDRRVQMIDLLERSVSDICQAFDRYLSFDKVRDGEAERNAATDLRGNVRTSAVSKVLPEAWRELLDPPDEELVQLLAAMVEEKCGFQPDLEQVGRFLQSRYQSAAPEIQRREEVESSGGRKRRADSSMRPVQDQTTTPLGAMQADVTPARSANGYTVEVLGRSTSPRYANESVAFVLLELAKRDSTFLERFANRKHGRKRRLIARNKLDLYPGRPDLAEEASVELGGSGWFMGTNYSVQGFRRHIQLACEVAGLKFGSDVKAPWTL